jgi:chromosome segregation ATPase
MAVNPEAKLSDLKAKLKEKEAEVGKLVKSKESLRAEVAALEKVVREIEQFSNAYSHALPNVEKGIEDMENYSQTRIPEFEAAAGDKKKDAVNTKIGELDSRIKKMKKEQRTLEDKVEKSKSDYEAVKQDYLTKQTEFESVKSLRKTIEDKLVDIKTLRASIEKEEKEGEETSTANIYFLMLELNQQLSAVKSEIKSAEEFKALLLNAWQELASAEAAVKRKEEQMRDAKEKYEMKKRELESTLQNRRKTILTELTNI